VSDFVKRFAAIFLAIVLGGLTLIGAGVLLVIVLAILSAGGAAAVKAQREAEERRMMEVNAEATRLGNEQYDLDHPGWREEAHFMDLLHRAMMIDPDRAEKVAPGDVKTLERILNLEQFPDEPSKDGIFK
jgi:hypothetical protein